MVGREKELKIRFVPGRCELVEVRGAAGRGLLSLRGSFPAGPWAGAGAGQRPGTESTPPPSRVWGAGPWLEPGFTPVSRLLFLLSCADT